MTKLSDSARNEYSQFGEDGIIEEILSICGNGAKTCVEFGAWDGVHYSNTAKLWKNGWKAVLIESDSTKFKELVAGAPGCFCLNVRITISGKDSIDQLLSVAGVEHVDLMSIDVDGDDYHIFKSMSIRPRIIICEYNPTIPIGIEVVGEPGEKIGASATALEVMARNKGYSPIAMTETNCFFVRSCDAPLFSKYETSMEKMFDPKHLTYLISAYDGTFLLSRTPTYGLADWNKNRLSNGKLRGRHV